MLLLVVFQDCDGLLDPIRPSSVLRGDHRRGRLVASDGSFVNESVHRTGSSR